MYKKRTSQVRKRHNRIRKKVSGTEKRPRLCLNRSLNNLTAQIIDDVSGKTLVSLSTFNKDIKKQLPYGGNKKAAEALGKIIAAKAKDKGITSVVFDRGGRQYHGRVKVFADAARKEGLQF